MLKQDDGDDVLEGNDDRDQKHDAADISLAADRRSDQSPENDEVRVEDAVRQCAATLFLGTEGQGNEQGEKQDQKLTGDRVKQKLRVEDLSDIDLTDIVVDVAGEKDFETQLVHLFQRVLIEKACMPQEDAQSQHTEHRENGA